MHSKDCWNIITNNEKQVTSHCEFRRCRAGDLFRDIGRIFIFLCNVWNTKDVSYVWLYFYP